MIIRFLFSLLLSYVAAAPLTSKISMDLTQTEWTNVWTYVIWVSSFAIWFVVLVVCLSLFLWWGGKRS